MDFKKRFEGKTSQIGREGHIANIAAPAQPITKEYPHKAFSNLSTQNNTGIAGAPAGISYKADFSELLSDSQAAVPIRARRSTGASIADHSMNFGPAARIPIAEEAAFLYNAASYNYAGRASAAPSEHVPWRSPPAQ